MLPDPFFWRGEHISVSLSGATAVFTTRRGGYSAGPYASLNLGRWTEDRREDVEGNRDLVERELGVGFAYGRQVHGTHVVTVDGPTDDAVAGVGGPAPEPVEADGQVTAEPGVAPMVLTADCLPIALAGLRGVAMLHAGWRGLAGGLLGAGAEALRALEGDDVTITAAIGPGAGPCCYEVSEAVHDRFAAREADLRRGGHLDLKAVARLELERAGVGEVHDVGLCTICSDPRLFYSHRRERGLTGRQAGIIWRS